MADATWDEFWSGPCPVCGEVPVEMAKNRPKSWYQYEYLDGGPRTTMLAHLHIDHRLWPSCQELPCCGIKGGQWKYDGSHLEKKHTVKEFEKLLALMALGGRKL